MSVRPEKEIFLHLTKKFTKGRSEEKRHPLYPYGEPSVYFYGDKKTGEFHSNGLVVEFKKTPIDIPFKHKIIPAFTSIGEGDFSPYGTFYREDKKYQCRLGIYKGLATFIEFQNTFSLADRVYCIMGITNERMARHTEKWYGFEVEEISSSNRQGMGMEKQYKTLVSLSRLEHYIKLISPEEIFDWEEKSKLPNLLKPS